MHCTDQNQNLHIDHFDLVAPDGLDLTRGHQNLRSVLRSILDTIHGVSSDLFQPDTATLPGESSDDSKKSDL